LDTGWHAAYLAGAVRHVGEGVGRQVDVAAHGRQHVARMTSGDVHHRPGGADVLYQHAEIAPFALEPFVERLGDCGRVAARGSHEEMVLSDAGEHAVVVDDPVLVEHEPVAAMARLQVAHAVDIYALQELGGVGALDLDLAERGRIEQAHRLADGAHLSLDRLALGFTIAREIGGAQPRAVRLHSRA